MDVGDESARKNMFSLFSSSVLALATRIWLRFTPPLGNVGKLKKKMLTARLDLNS